MIEFENGELVADAYVEINGVKYPVKMPEYSGNTSMCAENLNKIITAKTIGDANVNLNDFKKDGFYYFLIANTPINIPTFTVNNVLRRVNGWLRVIANEVNTVKQIFYAENLDMICSRSYSEVTKTWTAWKENLTTDILPRITDKTSLFKKDTGTTENLTVSENPANFEELEIWYKGSQGTEETEYCKKVRNVNADVDLEIIYRTSDTVTQIQHARLNFNELNVSFVNNVYTNIKSENGTVIGAGARILITEIIGINRKETN